MPENPSCIKATRILINTQALSCEHPYWHAVSRVLGMVLVIYQLLVSQTVPGHAFSLVSTRGYFQHTDGMYPPCFDRQKNLTYGFYCIIYIISCSVQHMGLSCQMASVQGTGLVHFVYQYRCAIRFCNCLSAQKTSHTAFSKDWVTFSSGY